MQALEALTRDAKALANGEIVLSAPEAEVARQLQICNACRYCEGFCASSGSVSALTPGNTGGMKRPMALLSMIE